MHSVYKLTVGGEPYFGYTSRDPKVRLEEHLKIAEKGDWKHRSKLYPLLVEMELEYEFEVLYEGDNELQALLMEIAAIRHAGKENTLNFSDGGEGSTMTVKTQEVNGQLQIMVVPRNQRVQQRIKSKGRKRRPRKRSRRRR